MDRLMKLFQQFEVDGANVIGGESSSSSLEYYQADSAGTCGTIVSTNTCSGTPSKETEDDCDYDDDCRDTIRPMPVA